MSYDKVLATVGEYGTYHKRVLVLLALLSMFSSFPAILIVFLFFDVPFRCRVPDLVNDTFHIQDEAHQRLVNASIPYDVTSGLYSKCSFYSSDQTGNTTETCRSWVFDANHASSSLVAELELVCDREHYKAHFTLMVMIGMLCAAVVAGPAADTFGRKRPMVFFVVLDSIALFLLASVPYIPVLLVLFMIICICMFATFLNIFTLLIEVIGASQRSWAGLGPMLAWPVGFCLAIPLHRYLAWTWRIPVLLEAVLGLVFITYLWIVPESPRWLLARNRTEEAQKIFKVMAKVNKVTLPEDLELTSVVESEQKSKGTRFPLQELKPLLTSRVMVLRVLIISFTWFTLNLIYMSTTFGVGSLVEGDIYINFLIQAVMEGLGYFLGFLLLNRFGRRVLLCAFLCIMGISYLVNAVLILLEIGIHWISLVAYGIGKFGDTGGFYVIYVQANEVMPTVVRNSAVGVCTLIGQFGGIVSPYLVNFDTFIPSAFGKALPLFVFVIFSGIAALLTLLLPETRNRKLPDTIEDAKHMRRKRPIYNGSPDDSEKVVT